ncbi:APC family permease [Actinoplanes sichuanensis]|uniref:APC family permease n=1 Tax=Actinoplanes sichuanensis TaxID=512349 RepID=A0ABW4ATZ9_9ACTN|nr:APC family permease [Actinoplanes sichuanensis]BEL04443.1 APC family permease [Actinoplanes sichuanensis]
MSETNNSSRAGRLGAPGVVFIVVAAAAPLSIMAGTAPFALSIGGLAAPAAYLVAGAVLTLFAVGFTRMTRVVHGGGAFYSYVTLGLGRRAGAATGVLALISYNAIQFGSYGLLGMQFEAAVARFTGLDLPWWVWSLLAVAAIWALGRRGAEVSACLLGVLLVVESLLLAALVVAVVAQGGHSGLSLAGLTPQAWGHPGILAALGIAFVCFMGFESTAIYRTEARHGDRTITRATYAAVAFLAVFYALVLWALVQAIGDADAVAVAGADPTAVLMTVIEDYLGAAAGTITYIFLVTSIFASQVAFHNAINRYARALAEDGLLPAGLQRVHPRFGSPTRAGAVQSIAAATVIVAAAILGADPFLQMTIWVSTPGTIGVLAMQCLASAAVAAFFLRRTAGRATAVIAAVSTVALVVLLALVIVNIDLITGAGAVTNNVLLTVPAVAFVTGLVAAGLLRHRRPAIYARIGGEDAQRVLAENPQGS